MRCVITVLHETGEPDEGEDEAAFWLLALFAIAVAVTLAARYNNGYVLVVAQPYRIELSLNLLIVLLVVAFFVAYFLMRLAVITLGCQRRSANSACAAAGKKRARRCWMGLGPS